MSFKLSRAPGEKKRVVKDPVKGGFELVEDVQTPEPSRTAKPVDVRITPPEGRLPAGYMYVWNRRSIPFEKWYDKQPQEFEPYEFKIYPEDIARWLVSKSVLTEQSMGRKAVRALALQGSKDWCKPLGDFQPLETIDRSHDPNPFAWGSGGLPTKPKTIAVDGGDPMDYRNY